MWPFYLTLFIFLGILIFPFLIVLLSINIFALGISNLGFSAATGFVIVLAMIFGSFVNLPLSEKEIIKIEDSRFFGAFQDKISVRRGLSINLGGAIIPLFISSILMPNAPLVPTLVVTFAAIIVSYKTSKVIPAIGVSMPPLFTVLTVVIFSLLLAPENPQIVAFISGVLGTLIGADLLNLKEVMDTSHSTMIIGGAGVFDGIFLIGIISSLLAGI